MKKTSMMVLAMSFMTACGTATMSQVKKSGTNVNNGPGPVGDILTCQNPEAEIDFTIRHTAAVTFKQGIVKFGEDAVSLKCDEVEASVGAPDAQTALWKCTELRQGEGLLRVNVYAQGNSAIVLADVTRDQMFPLGPKKIATLGCQSAAE